MSILQLVQPNCLWSGGSTVIHLSKCLVHKIRLKKSLSVRKVWTFLHLEQNVFTLETSCIDYVSSMGASHGLTSLPAICTARHSPYVFLQTKVCFQKMKL